jgi:HEAT repeat protein
MSQRGSWLAAGVCAALLLVTAVLAFAPGQNESAVELVERDRTEVAGAENGSDESANGSANVTSPFATAAELSRLEPSSDPVSSASGAATSAASDLQQTDPQLPPIDVREIAREPLSDEAFESLVERLRSDPALLAALVNEARAETDPERLNWLLRLLGDVDDPAVVALATEFVYSGDTAQQQLGLDLMKRVKPGDPDVLASVSGLLSTEVDGQVLVPALTALARPSDVDDGTRATLVSQVAILTDHADPSVRRTSLTILSRWTDDATYTPQLLAGLDDVDQSVRSSAAFALVGHEDASPQVRDRLMATADSRQSGEDARRGAILALKRMPLEPDERERVLAIERRLDSRPLR